MRPGSMAAARWPGAMPVRGCRWPCPPCSGWPCLRAADGSRISETEKGEIQMKRRPFLLAVAALPLAARAHHGWSSFDQDRPLFLQGRVVSVKWQNPHAELVVELPADYKVPADLA